MLVLGVFSFILCVYRVISASNNPTQVIKMPPHLRSQLARTLYNRMMEDEHQSTVNHDYWYEVDEKDFPSDIVPLFVQCDEDTETKTFLDNCYEKSDWLFTQIYYGLAASILQWFLTQTSINGLLRRGSMFVYSEKQFLKLIGEDLNWKASMLLDLGAGDGEVTKHMSGHFSETHCTEMSTPMTWRLTEKGYKIVGIDDWYSGTPKYDVISCLNVLDRCEKPHTLLQNIKSALVPGTGKAVIAVVLPYSPYVEFNKSDHSPSERLPTEGRGFEDQASSLIHNFFQPNGFKVERFTRVPYLCEGDLETSFYILDDAVFVLSVPVMKYIDRGHGLRFGASSKILQ